MSFRTRLTSFFVVIVIVPMLAVGFLVFRLIDQSQQGKADARANGLATAAGSIYTREAAAGRLDAETIAKAIGTLRGAALHTRVAQLASQSGIARVMVTDGGRELVAVGSPAGIAPGVAVVTPQGGSRSLTVTASESPPHRSSESWAPRASAWSSVRGRGRWAPSPWPPGLPGFHSAGRSPSPVAITAP